MFHLFSYDLIQSEALKYKVSNVSSPSVVESFSVNSCSYELFAMNPSFIFLASASSPSSTSLSKVLLPSSWSLRSSDVSIKVPGVATFHGLKLGVLFALRGCFAFLKTWEKMFCFESVLAMPWSTCLHFLHPPCRKRSFCCWLTSSKTRPAADPLKERSP